MDSKDLAIILLTLGVAVLGWTLLNDRLKILVNKQVKSYLNKSYKVSVTPPVERAPPPPIPEEKPSKLEEKPTKLVNEETWDWVDWRGRPRKITVHRRLVSE